MKVKIQKLDPNATIPEYASAGASGFDLCALENIYIKPGETRLVRTGLAMDVGYDYELQVRPRSGLSLNTPFRVSNSPGTVDSDYRGEISVIMTNTAGWSWKRFNPWYKGLLIKKGDRIAQGVVCPVSKATFVVTDSLSKTDRGADGFGSTGT